MTKWGLPYVTGTWGQAAANGRLPAATCKSAAFRSAPPSVLNGETRVKRHQSEEGGN